MADIGMNDKQFNCFICFLLDALKDIETEKEPERKKKKKRRS